MGGLGRRRTGDEPPEKFLSFFTGPLQKPLEGPSTRRTLQGHPPTPTGPFLRLTAPSHVHRVFLLPLQLRPHRVSNGGKLLFHDGSDLLSNHPVFLLRAIARPQADVMEPATDGPIHEQLGRRSQRQHLSGTLLSHTHAE